MTSPIVFRPSSTSFSFGLGDSCIPRDELRCSAEEGVHRAPSSDRMKKFLFQEADYSKPLQGRIARGRVFDSTEYTPRECDPIWEENPRKNLSPIPPKISLYKTLGKKVINEIENLKKSSPYSKPVQRPNGGKMGRNGFEKPPIISCYAKYFSLANEAAKKRSPKRGHVTGDLGLCFRTYHKYKSPNKEVQEVNLNQEPIRSDSVLSRGSKQLQSVEKLDEIILFVRKEVTRSPSPHVVGHTLSPLPQGAPGSPTPQENVLEVLDRPPSRASGRIIEDSTEEATEICRNESDSEQLFRKSYSLPTRHPDQTPSKELAPQATSLSASNELYSRKKKKKRPGNVKCTSR